MPKEKTRPKSHPEEHLARQLDYAGYRYLREFRFSKERLWRVDFNLLDFGLMVEVEGIQYGRKYGRHQSAIGFTHDCEKYNNLTKLGFRLLRFTPKMIQGTQTRGKRKIKMQSAIECINDVCFGTRAGKIDRDKGYAKRAMERWNVSRTS